MGNAGAGCVSEGSVLCMWTVQALSHVGKKGSNTNLRTVTLTFPEVSVLPSKLSVASKSFGNTSVYLVMTPNIVPRKPREIPSGLLRRLSWGKEAG